MNRLKSLTCEERPVVVIYALALKVAALLTSAPFFEPDKKPVVFFFALLFLILTSLIYKLRTSSSMPWVTSSGFSCGIQCPASSTTFRNRKFAHTSPSTIFWMAPGS